MEKNNAVHQNVNISDSSPPHPGPLPASEEKGTAPTPMMAQYWSIKKQYPDALVFYRMGDFFELFFDDARAAAPVLDIALTRRGKHDDTDVPMCGVPVHSYESYLAKLIQHGFHVAICDQTETPEQAKTRGGAKALVTREVIRVITPGTITEETLLDARIPNYLAAVTQIRGQMSVAWLDLSTGSFMTQSVTRDTLAGTLARLAPREILIPNRLYTQPDIASTLKLYDRAVHVQPDSLFDSDNAARRLNTHYDTHTIDAFGAFDIAEMTAAGVLLDYVERTQKTTVMHIARPVRVMGDTLLHLDGATRRNLELTETLSGSRAGSVLHTIDRTVTSAGARMLQRWISAPLRDLVTITTREDQIEYFVGTAPLRDMLRNALKSAPDIERALARIALDRMAPRDLAAVRDGLATIATINTHLHIQPDLPSAITDIIAQLHQSPDTQVLQDTLSAALSDTLPATKDDGGFIRAGYDTALDQARSLRDDGRHRIAALQQKYATDTGIETLKITHNNMLGYYIEVSSKRADVLFARPADFIHRQTMSTATRFTTTELAGLERGLMQAGAQALAIEMQIFKDLCGNILHARDEIVQLATALAHLDVVAALAQLAVTEHYTRPTMRNDNTFDVRDGRHVVVEAALRAANTPFIANDAHIDDGQRLWVLTGPNMAGKSTFLRQNALIILLAQMGSFVPASSATIGLVDRLFSRVGAADDLAKGQSTFMVEMVETASILNQATARSFVILDEIGRGTATFDGLSIAWATLEYLHDIVQCRGLFATHYHELTTLHDRLRHVHLATMEVKEWQGDVVFLHQVRDGVAAGSYGIHVARLAGLPVAVTTRADQIMTMLSTGDQKRAIDTLAGDLPLFDFTAGPARAAVEPKTQAVIDAITALDIDALSPREALERLYELKSQIK